PGDPLRQRYRLAGQVDDVAAGGKAHEAEVHGVDLTRGGDPLLQVVGEHGVQALDPQVLDLDVDQGAVAAARRNLDLAGAGRRAQRRAARHREGGDGIDSELGQDVDAV